MLGPQVRQRRRALGLTQAELANLAGVSPRFVHALETGKASVQLDRVQAVLGVLGLRLDATIDHPETAPEHDA